MTIDEAIEHAKRVARTCDDDQCAAYHVQLAEWLRQARGADKAAKWYTAKIRELENRSKALETLISEKDTENAKLVEVLHEVEAEAVHAYRCLQQDCVTTANSSQHFFDKWWHAECELDRLKIENTDLRELVKAMRPFLCCMPFASCDTLAANVRDRMRDLGIE